jgi:hypothetical protein
MEQQRHGATFATTCVAVLPLTKASGPDVAPGASQDGLGL